MSRIEAIWYAGPGDERRRVQVVVIVPEPGLADAGVGKTAVATEALRRIVGGADRSPRVARWSPASQAGPESQLVGDLNPYLFDTFIQGALKRFKVPPVGEAGPMRDARWEGEALGRRLIERGGIIFLDGLERLQDDPGGYCGLGHDGLISLLRTVADEASATRPSPDIRPRSLCIVTTQLPLGQLRRDFPGTVEEIRLGHLTPDVGADLLADLWGMGKAGPSRRELEDCVSLFSGRPLDIKALAGYLRESGRRDLEPVYESIRDRDYTGVLCALHEYFEEHDRTPANQCKLELLRVLGLSEGSISYPTLASLAESPIAHLTDWLSGVGLGTLRSIIDRFAETALLIDTSRSAIGVHGLIANHEISLLEQQFPDAFLDGHRRLAATCLLQADGARKRGEHLERIELEYRAVHHFCRAGEFGEAFQVYQSRIQGEAEGSVGLPTRRAIVSYGVVNPAGLYGFHRTDPAGGGLVLASPAERGRLLDERGSVIIASFAVENWHKARLAVARRGLRAAEAAFRRWGVLAQGRGELEKARKARRDQSEQLARLSEVMCIQGDTEGALQCARRGVEVLRAHKGEPGWDRFDGEQLAHNRVMLGRVHHQRGELPEGQREFELALAEHPDGRLDNIFALWHAELLIDLALAVPGKESHLKVAAAIARRIVDERGEGEDGDLLATAYSHLVLGQLSILSGRTDDAIESFAKTEDKTRSTHQQPHVAYVLLKLGQAFLARGKVDEARRAAREALNILRSGTADEMSLYLADYDLLAAGLSLSRGDLEEAKDELARARKGIGRCSYQLRAGRLDRLERTRDALARLQDEVYAIAKDVCCESNILTNMIYINYNFLMLNELSDSKEQHRRRGEPVEPKLDQASLTKAALEPELAEQLRERLQAALHPLVAELGSIRRELATGTGEAETRRLVWSVVEQSVRTALEDWELKPVPFGESTGADAASLGGLSDERTLRAWEAAQRFGINQKYLANLANLGRLGRKVGTRYMFSEKELADFVRSAPGKGGRRKQAT